MYLGSIREKGYFCGARLFVGNTQNSKVVLQSITSGNLFEYFILWSKCQVNKPWNVYCVFRINHWQNKFDSKMGAAVEAPYLLRDITYGW